MTKLNDLLDILTDMTDESIIFFRHRLSEEEIKEIKKYIREKEGDIILTKN